jgi:hypothetical protein
VVSDGKSSPSRRSEELIAVAFEAGVGGGEGGFDDGPGLAFAHDVFGPELDGLAFDGDAGGVTDPAIGVIEVGPGLEDGLGAGLGVVQGLEVAAEFEVVGEGAGGGWGGGFGAGVGDAVDGGLGAAAADGEVEGAVERD